jgi:tetratricopeptide (TPR) repeat protein
MVFSALVALALQPDPAMLQRLYEEALARRKQEYGVSDTRTARAASDLGLFLRGHGDKQGAQQALTLALAIDQKARGAVASETLADAENLAEVSPPAEAERLWTRAAQNRDPAAAARALAALGELREAAGDRPGAAKFYRRALAKEEAAAGKSAARVAVRLNALALAVDPREGIPLLERALAINRRTWGEQHPETATTETNLSGLLLAAGRTDEAVRLGRAALAAFEVTLGGDHPRTAAAASNLADALRAKGNRSEAERLYRRALAIDERAYGPQGAETLKDVRNLAGFLREIGRAREAAELDRHLKISGAP